jgi:hypothetical protein
VRFSNHRDKSRDLKLGNNKDRRKDPRFSNHRDESRDLKLKGRKNRSRNLKLRNQKNLILKENLKEGIKKNRIESRITKKVHATIRRGSYSKGLALPPLARGVALVDNNVLLWRGNKKADKKQIVSITRSLI